MARTLETALGELHPKDQGRLVAWLAGRFPDLGWARAEESAQEAYYQVMAHPGTRACAERALAAGGPSALRRLLYCVARRDLRAQARRKAWRSEAVLPVGVEFAADGEPELEFAVREHAARAGATARASVPHVAGAANARHRRQIAAALFDLLADPDLSQQALAAQHGIRREYLCRAWRGLVTQVVRQGARRPTRLAA